MQNKERDMLGRKQEKDGTKSRRACTARGERERERKRLNEMRDLASRERPSREAKQL
jgi:hypothetical protein